jgi:transcriptional regulator with XRE-family HTH domain
MERGLIQEELAEAARVHPTYVSRVETNKLNPTIAACYRLARALKRPLASMVAEAESDTR